MDEKRRKGVNMRQARPSRESIHTLHKEGWRIYHTVVIAEEPAKDIVYSFAIKENRFAVTFKSRKDAHCKAYAADALKKKIEEGKVFELDGQPLEDVLPPCESAGDITIEDIIGGLFAPHLSEQVEYLLRADPRFYGAPRRLRKAISRRYVNR